MNAIEISGLNKRFEGFSLQDISLSLPSGCIMGLIGENGAGKSTTINLIMNSIKKDSGKIEVLSVDNTDKKFYSLKEEIGVVLDEAYFPEVLNAKQVNKILKYTYKSWDEKLYYGYLKQFALPETKMFKDYSRGMKMKLAIAAALSHSPKLLILDEATSGLDPIVRDEILNIFNDFTREDDHSILLSSHITSDLEKICDYIAFIHKGKLLFCEEKDSLLSDYAIVSMTKDQAARLDKKDILGARDNGYGSDILIKKQNAPSGCAMQRLTIEEIMLLLVKGGKTE